MDQLIRDFRFALRGFRRTPAFAVATTAIPGIGVLVTTAIAAAYTPARRATRIDPIEALRAD